MMGPSHRIAGAAAWVCAAPLLGVHGVGPLLAGAGIAGACAHGVLSPDMDQHGLLAKVIPGGHRSWTHWWAITALGWWATTFITTDLYKWAAWAVVISWISHIATDAAFGTVPLLPRLSGGWIRFGFHFRTGGPVEKWVAVPLFSLAAAWTLLPASIVSALGF